MRVARRHLVVSAAAAAGTLGLIQPVIAAGSPAASPSDTPTPTPTPTVTTTATPTPTPTATTTASPTATPTTTTTPTTTPTTSAPVTNPGITAVATSKNPPLNGWYNNVVTITFTCTPGSSAFASPCPDPMTVAKPGANQPFTGTVSDTDGGSASTTVTLNIDLGAPTIAAVNPKAGTCRAHDPLSGVSSCVVHKHRTFNSGRLIVRWVAVAIDNAGNVAKEFGHYPV